MILSEGGNAKAKNGAEASKVNISEFDEEQYESYRKDIIKLVLAIDKAFKDFAEEPLFASPEIVKSYKVFSGSGNTFFTRTREEYTAIKPKIGDIDVQIDETKKEKVREFLQKNEGTKFAGFKLLGTQFGGDFFNVFEAPKKYNPVAKNIQIDFEFIAYDEEGNPDEFDVFSKNSDWADMKEGIKGFAKQQLIPAIYKAVYAKPGVVFQNNKDLPSKAYKRDEVSSKTFGPKGSRDKYAPVLDADGKQVEYEGKPAFREIPTNKSTFNKNLDSAFEEMFGKKPSADEKKKMYSFVGVLSLMKKYLNKNQIQRVFKFYYDDISKRIEDDGVLDAIFNKFKEVFPNVYSQDESISFDKYVKMTMIGESMKDNKVIKEANEVAGSEENMYFIAKTITDNLEKGNDGKPARVWISGGAVRDEILGKPCNDIDLLTNCDVKDVAALFDKCEVARTGNSRLARVWIGNDLFELGCLEEGDTVEENLNNRDLTCNAILKDLTTGNYYDPIGGIKDIKAKKINLTRKGLENISAGKDPAKLIRTFRFMSQLGWSFGPETVAAIKSYSKINNGKIKIKLGAALGPANWKKMIKGKYKDKALKELEKFGFLDWAKETFPEDFNDIKTESKNAQLKKQIQMLQEQVQILKKVIENKKH